MIIDKFTDQNLNIQSGLQIKTILITSVNEYRRQLFDLCIETKLRILNGRTHGDLQGHLTYAGFHGCSTVNLVLTSEASLTKSTIV